MFNAKAVKNEIVDWIRGIFSDSPESSAVIGISGGKDSTVAAALCAEALGADRVYGVLMPMGEQDAVAREVVEHLGIEHSTVSIKNSADALYADLHTSGLTPNTQAKINTPARLRMTVLYAVSAIVNGRVANTCNLSEDWVGYSTKFGDSAGDFSPLSQLTATEVKLIGRELGLPSKFTEKPPEDGLSGMTDEENLGFSYGVLDKYIREGICEDAELKAKIDKLHKKNRHKLEPMPAYASNATIQN